MPIRFRCVYCNKLLGIARRKAGAVVSCPQCRQSLIVPTPETENSATAASVGSSVVNQRPTPAGDRLFERDDFDVYLDDGPTFAAEEKESDPPPPPVAFAAERDLPQPRIKRDRSTLMMSRSTAILVAVLFFILMVIAFGAGILVGRAIA